MKRIIAALCLLASPALADTLNYAPLISAWPSIPGKAPSDKIAAYNAQTAASAKRQDVAVSEVASYLGLRGILTAMEDWLVANPVPSAPRTAAKELLRAINGPHITTFRMSNPATYATVSAMLNSLVGPPSSLLTAQNVTDLLALAVTTQPQWQADGFPVPPSVGDASAAGLK